MERTTKIGYTSAAFDRRAILSVVPPYRLDLTVAVLRRLSTNLIDVVAPDGTYLRVLRDAGERPFAIAVRQTASDTLELEIRSDDAEYGRESASADVARLEIARALARRTLGCDRHAAYFAASAATLPWLAGIAQRMTGVRPPRYATLWEACVNAIVFQQVSLHAAAAILGRVVRALGTPLAIDGTVVHAFFGPEAFLASDDALLRTAGLSVAKIATLRRVAGALADRTLDENELDALPSAAIAAHLCAIKGIGPWTAAVVLLRGFGRLDVFPQNDSGVARSLRALANEPIDVAAALHALAPEQGMLYYHLLLARLDATGALGAS